MGIGLLLEVGVSLGVGVHRDQPGGEGDNGGDTWTPSETGPPVVLIHDTCGNVTPPMLTCPHCHGEVSAANTHSAPGPGARPAPAAAHS